MDHTVWFEAEIKLNTVKIRLSWNNWNFCSFFSYISASNQSVCAIFSGSAYFWICDHLKTKILKSENYFVWEVLRGSWNLSFVIGWWSFEPQIFLQMSSHCQNTAKSTLSGNFFFRCYPPPLQKVINASMDFTWK